MLLRNSRLAALALLILLLSSGAVAAESEAAPREVIDGIAALVGSEVVTLHDVDQALAPYLPDIYRIADPGERMAAIDKKRFEMLDSLVNEMLVLEEARRLELPVTDEEVEAHVHKTMLSNGWTEEELVANLAQLGYGSLDAYREKTRREMLKAYAFQIRVGSRVNVTAEEIDREYAARHPDGMQEEVRASHILLRIPEVITIAKLGEMRDEAERIRALAVSGEQEFGELAALYSQDTATARDGGDLGYFTRFLLDETFTKHAFALQPGELSDVVQTKFGFHIIKVTDRRKVEIDDFAKEELRGFIQHELTTQARERAYRQWMRELRESAYIDTRMKSLLP